METDEAAQEATETEAQEATTNDATTTEATEETTTEAKPDEGLAEVKKLRAEAAALRKRAKTAEAELETRREAELTEAQKITKRAEDAEAKAQEADARAKQAALKAEVAVQASKANIDPTLALRQVRDDVTFDDDTGEPVNVTELIAGLAEAHPELVQQGRAQAGGPANAGRQSTSTEQTETDAEKYSRLLGGGGGPAAMWRAGEVTITGKQDQ